MKKLFTGIISAIMVLSLGVTAVAAQTITEPNTSKDIDVQAKAVYISPEDVYTAPVTDDKAEITMKTDVVISIDADGAELDGLTLNVIEINKEDKDAYAWLSGVMSGLCDAFTAYDIYFTDKGGNRVDVTGEVAVSITTPNGYTNLQVYHIGSSKKPDEIESKQSEKNTMFTAKGFSYYVLADKANGTTNPTNPSNPDKPIEPNAPHTGDSGNMMLCFTLLLVSGGILMVLSISSKRKNTGKIKF